MIKNTTTKSRRPSAAIVISCLALFLALTGSAFAAKSLVRSGNIVNGTIRTVDLHDNAVRSPKIADATITANDLATDSVGTDEIQADAVTDSEIAPNAVTGSEIASSAVSATKIAPNAVDASRLDSVFQRQSASQAIAAGATGTVSVTCPGGEQILSGGGQPGNFGVEMTSSRPTANGWLYQAKNQNASASTITAFALCLAS